MSPSSEPAVRLTVSVPGVWPPPTTAVCADVAGVDPAAFVAVATRRIVAPTSAPTRAYEFEVALPMSPQLAPAESQRRHWYVYVIGCVPVQVPFAAVSACPDCAVPEIVGRAVFPGGVGGAATTAV